MNIAVFGAEGQLGSEVMKVGSSLGWNMTPIGHTATDAGWYAEVGEYENVLNTIGDIDRYVAPLSAVVNCAAYHNMPLCAKYPGLAWQINAGGPANICRALSLRKLTEDILFVHVSTDCVFGEDKQPIYQEDSMRVPFTGGDDKGIYGQSKLAGELAIQMCGHRWAIARVSTLFGATGCRAKNGGNLIDSIAQRALAGDDMTMHTNTRVSVTYAPDAAKAICRTIQEMQVTMDHSRIIHACNDTGPGVSHYEIALCVCKELGLIEERDYNIFGETTSRPRRSPLNPTYQMPGWERAIRQYIHEKGWKRANAN